MQIKCHKYNIEITVDSIQDEIYLENVLGLKKKGDVAIAERVAPMGLENAWAYLKIHSKEADLSNCRPVQIPVSMDIKKIKLLDWQQKIATLLYNHPEGSGKTFLIDYLYTMDLEK